MPSSAAYRFVAVVFAVLGLAFVASTLSVIIEFRDAGWLDHVMASSHLFIFFPTLGLLALVAFYLPAVAFTDLYWRHMRWGKARYFFGLAAVIVGSIYFALLLHASPLRGIWEVAPAAIEADRPTTLTGSSPCLDGQGNRCVRRPVGDVLRTLRTEAQARTSIIEFGRPCSDDPMVEQPESQRALRYCFPAAGKLDTARCCAVQRSFAAQVAALYRGSGTRSDASAIDEYLLPFKVFFIIVLVLIGIFMTVWRRQLIHHYAPILPAIERGVIVGALAMLIWPLMDYAHVQTMDVLYGKETRGLAFRYSLVIAPWAVLLVFYFVAQLRESLARVAQFSTIIGSALALLRFQEIIEWSSRMVGTGAGWPLIAALAIISIFGIGWLVYAYRKWPPVLRDRPQAMSRASRPEGRDHQGHFPPMT